MVTAFDRIVVAVPDLAAAAAQYERLLGVAPAPPREPLAVPSMWVGLPNTVLELQERQVGEAALAGIFLRAPEGFCPPFDDRGLALSLDNGAATAHFRQRQPAAQCQSLPVDHLVLRTSDADACIELFGTRLGMRLALDRTVPEWGGRMLFFRAGGLTLEVIYSGSEAKARDRFWGIAFQCHAIDRTAAEMIGRGVSLSEIRDGRKPGTRVATVKSCCLDLPTLLIEQAR